ncbi:hypothetical protein [uncultured Clostridium sp.]|uniref:hypothetical protein n=1 Tax=uncultured Clostridium sp. TaxID=59620 RepID=UPI00261651C9|nr:hypothetical protein [uncultured Clostridium sp.]
MPIKYYNIENNDIEKYIESKRFKNFNEEMRRKLDIEDIEYEIVIKKHNFDENGYINTTVQASARFDEKYLKVKEIIFYIDNIKESMGKFRKLFGDENISKGIKEIVIEIALVHELIHIQQFKKGIINLEYMGKENKKEYEERAIEKEAKEKSYKIIERKGSLERIAVDYIKNNKEIINDDVKDIINRLNTTTNRYKRI